MVLRAWLPTSRKRWFRLAGIIATGALAVALAILAFLRLANPQWHSTIYVWQVYTCPRTEVESPPKDFVGPWGPADEAGVRPRNYDGVWVDWHRNGVRAALTTYRQGLAHGVHVKYASDGSKVGEENYEAGVMHGVFRTYYRGGRKAFEANYSRGMLDGPATRWDESGEVLAQGTYRDGSPWSGTFLESAEPKPRRVFRAGDVRFVRNTYVDGKPWDGQFLVSDNASKDLIVRTLKEGVEVTAEPHDPSGAE